MQFCWFDIKIWNLLKENAKICSLELVVWCHSCKALNLYGSKNVQ